MTTPFAFFGFTPHDLERIKASADLEQRKAKAWMDQNPLNEERRDLIQGYITLAALGTCYAIHDSEDSEPPVPTRIIEANEPFYVPHPDNALGEAWRDITGAVFTENDWGLDTILMPGIPVYEGTTGEHHQVNARLITKAEWFVATLTVMQEESRARTHRMRQIAVNEYIEHLLKQWEGKDRDGSS